MGHLYFVRHGETIWNVENKICGATDIALTDRGHEQAIATGEELVRQGVHIAKILYSPHGIFRRLPACRGRQNRA